jgi:ABC-type Mn2+/Zn2+ transport system permease subunit
MDFLLKPFEYIFMQRALIELVLLSILTGVVGTFLVLRNSAFISEGLSHGVYPGIVVSFILRINSLVSAIFFGVLTVLGITLVSRNKKITENNAIVILFTTLFALGIIIRKFVNTAQSLSDFLIGNIIGISSDDVLITLLVVITVVVIFCLFQRQLIISTFDKVFATSLGIKVWLVDLTFNILVAITVVIAIQAVGNILVIALLIIPPLIARILTKNIYSMITASILLTLVCSIIGIYISYYLNYPVGATVILFASFLFFLVNLLRNR